MPKSKNNPSEKKTVRGITTRVRTALENTARQLQLSADGLPIASGEKPINVIVAFSGGLDSSLVCSIAAKKLGKPIRTFAIGMDTDAIDLKYAREVAEYLHADHTGNAHALEELGCRLIMGRKEYGFMRAQQELNWGGDIDRAMREGADAACLENARDNKQSFLFESEPFSADCVDDGDELCCGGHRLRCILTPGHTPGHMCLYSAQNMVAEHHRLERC